MLDWYQMTMEEMLDAGAKPPVSETGTSPGATVYSCRLCGAYVGYYNSGVSHMEKGWHYRRDKCKYGHEIDWSPIDEALQT